MELLNMQNNLTESNSELMFLQIDQIDLNPHQPRLAYNNQKLVALAEHIKNCGVLEPILVIRKPDGYTLIAGHRRLAASKIAGLEIIPARLLPTEMFDVLGTAVAENMLRENLTPFEVALALGKLVENGVNRNELCVITGLATYLKDGFNKKKTSKEDKYLADQYFKVAVLMDPAYKKEVKIAKKMLKDNKKI